MAADSSILAWDAKKVGMLTCMTSGSSPSSAADLSLVNASAIALEKLALGITRPK